MYTMRPPNPTCLQVLVVSNLVFRWPKLAKTFLFHWWPLVYVIMVYYGDVDPR